VGLPGEITVVKRKLFDELSSDWAKKSVKTIWKSLILDFSILDWFVLHFNSI